MGKTRRHTRASTTCSGHSPKLLSLRPSARFHHQRWSSKHFKYPLLYWLMLVSTLMVGTLMKPAVEFLHLRLPSHIQSLDLLFLFVLPSVFCSSFHFCSYILSLGFVVQTIMFFLFITFMSHCFLVSSFAASSFNFSVKITHDVLFVHSWSSSHKWWPAAEHGARSGGAVHEEGHSSQWNLPPADQTDHWPPRCVYVSERRKRESK